jgi:hypothetical protein
MPKFDTTASTEVSGSGNRLGIAFVEPDAGVRGTRQRQHRWREIEARRQRAALGRRGGDDAWAAGEVEHPHRRRHSRRVEQRSDEFPGRAGEGRAVIRRRLFPAGALEGADRFRIEAHCGFWSGGASKRRSGRTMVFTGFSALPSKVK